MVVSFHWRTAKRVSGLRRITEGPLSFNPTSRVACEHSTLLDLSPGVVREQRQQRNVPPPAPPFHRLFHFSGGQRSARADAGELLNLSQISRVTCEHSALQVESTGESRVVGVASEHSSSKHTG